MDRGSSSSRYDDTLLHYDGVKFFALPPHVLKNRNQIDMIKQIKDIDMREDDVMICAYMKCGNHWLWEIVEMLRSGRTVFKNMSEAFQMLEISLKEGVDSVESPRTLNSHLPLRMLPRQLVEKRVKVIQMMRNPKDVCVSSFNHLSKKVFSSFDGSFQEYIDEYLKGNVPFGAYYDYILTWRREAAQPPKLPILTLFYEDMKTDGVACIKKIADFLNISTSEDFCKKVNDACSFKNMKESEKAKHVVIQLKEGGSLYRKGEIGDWKNWFTVADNEKFDRIWSDKMKDSDIAFTYS